MRSVGISVLLGCALVLALMQSPSAAEGPGSPPVQVYVQQSAKRGAVTHRYRVVNHSPTEITGLWIGWDFSGEFQLLVPPIGWDGETVPSASFRAPQRWHFEMIRTEEDSILSAHWEIDTSLAVIPSGATVSGFEVTLPKPDSLYRTGCWSVTVSGGPAPYYTGVLKSEPWGAGRVRADRKRGSR